MMNSIYEKNLLALQGRYPKLSAEVRETVPGPAPAVIRIWKNDPLPDILFSDRGKEYLCYDNKNPVDYCGDYIRSLDLKFAPFLTLFGFGLGYQLVTLLNDFSEVLKIRHMLIIEKDIRLFKKALEILDFSKAIMHPAIHLFVGMEPQELFVEFINYFARNPGVLEYTRNLKIIILPAVHRVEGEYYENAARSFQDAINHVFEHIGNDPYDSLIGIYHTISNLRPIIEDPGIIAFKNIFAGKPGIVIGAGPSLNKNIHLLKEARQKAVLISVDAALKPLLEAGIRPHIVTNIERRPGQDLFFRDRGNLEDTFFVFSPVVPSETYDAYKGPKIIAHRYEELMHWLNIPKGSLTGGPLVGNFAFNIAQYIGCSPIILVGQDLSFKPAGSTHVKGMVFDCLDAYQKDAIEVEGNYEDILLTTRSFEEGRKAFEVQIECYTGLCINATEGGARIRSSLLLDLRCALDTYCKTSFDPLIHLKEIWNTEKSGQKDTEGEIKRIGAVIDNSLSEMEIAIRECRKGIEIIESVLDNHAMLIGERPNPDLLNRITGASGILYGIRTGIISLPAFKIFEMVIQSSHFEIEMERNFTIDRYYNAEFATLKSFLLLKDWFAVVGQLILSTFFAVKREKNFYAR
ncbi:MAG: DUF115 domain-containing protein [Desulfobacteraceae bacterium]|nr:MAG: DUF115 domain-containing protein [Desulfobacteraceae bacterium]